MTIWQASRPTVIDSRIRGKAFWNEEFKFLVLERVKDLIEDSDAVRSLPFTLLFAPSMSLRNFSRFRSRLPFRVFTLESHFFILILFHFSIVLLCTWKSKIHPKQVDDLSRFFLFFFWLKKRDDSLVDYENFLKEKPLQSKFPRSIKMDFSGTYCRPSLWFRKKG